MSEEAVEQVRSVHRAEAEKRFTNPTNREFYALSYESGLSRSDLAAMLKISPYTVDGYRRHESNEAYRTVPEHKLDLLKFHLSRL